jgi:AcrR family transcriptional regulator
MELFQASSYEAVNVADVAKRSGIAKGTVYLYFRTKEELFLALQEAELEAWFDEIDTLLHDRQAVRGACTADELVALTRRSLEDRATMARLFAILHTILEHNIDFATALAFKHVLRERLLKTGSLLEGCLPFLKPGQGAQTLMHVYALLIGIQSLSEPAPVIRQILEEPGMDIFKIDFLDEFSEAMRSLLCGLEYQAKRDG